MEKKEKNKGFTLLEILTVIVIIGLIAVASIVILSNSRAKSRDAKRMTDMKNLATAVDLYQYSHDLPPARTGTWAALGTGSLAPYLPSGSPFDPTTNLYIYCVNGGATPISPEKYLVAAQLEAYKTVNSIPGDIDVIPAWVDGGANYCIRSDNQRGGSALFSCNDRFGGFCLGIE